MKLILILSPLLFLLSCTAVDRMTDSEISAIRDQNKILEEHNQLIREQNKLISEIFIR